MLSINNSVGLQSDHREHAWALRTIGQNLVDLRPEYLEIEFTGQVYLARGRSQRQQITATKSRGGKIFGTFGSSGKRTQQRESSWFERRYTLYEINRLDDQGLVQRKDHASPPDIYVLGERLRTIGKMIEARDGQLIKLTLDNHRAAFTFRDATGTVYHEEHSTPALYRSQQDGNRSRGTGRTRDPWNIHATAARENTIKKGKFRLMSDRILKGNKPAGDNE
jgi:hypothetical protein